MLGSVVLFYLAGVNLAAFAAFGIDKFGIDKRKAVRHRWRIPEATLLGLCLLGGALGGLAGMHLFHHKTRKARFFVGVPVMLALQLGLGIALLFFLRG